MSLRYNLTEGSVRRQILTFVLPILMTNLLQAMYNAVDMFFVGRYSGTVVLASVAVAGPVMNIMIMTISGLSVGVAITIGGHLGAGNKSNIVRKCANTAITFYLIAAVIITAAGLVCTPLLVSAVQTPAEAVAGAIQYMRIIFAGMAGMFGYNLISAFQRGCGDAQTPFYFVLFATIINIVLDWLLIGVFLWGAAGAAIATVTAQSLSFISGVVYFERKKHIITFRPKEFKIDKTQLKLIFHVGMPAAIQAFLNNFSFTTVSGVANSYGLAASAGYGVSTKLTSFLMMPLQAGDSAVATFASQNIGALKPERAMEGLKESIKLSLIYAVASVVIVFFFASPLSAVFDNTPEVIGYSAGYMKIYCVSQIWMSVMFACSGFLRGTGNPHYSLISCIATQYVVRIPLVFIMAGRMGFYGIAWASLLSSFISLSIYGGIVLSGRWKNSREVRRITAWRNQSQELSE